MLESLTSHLWQWQLLLLHSQVFHAVNHKLLLGPNITNSQTPAGAAANGQYYRLPPISFLASCQTVNFPRQHSCQQELESQRAIWCHSITSHICHHEPINDDPFKHVFHHIPLNISLISTSTVLNRPKLQAHIRLLRNGRLSRQWTARPMQTSSNCNSSSSAMAASYWHKVNSKQFVFFVRHG